MQILHASWILPIAQPPIRDGWVALDGGRIAALGSGRKPAIDQSGKALDPTASETDLGHVAILPALVNAHTHLELSWMRGKVPAGDRFSDWIRSLIALRGQAVHAVPDESVILDAIKQCRLCGTGLVGDVANSMVTLRPLAASALHAVIFYELIGFKNADAGRLIAQARGQLRTKHLSPNVRLTLAAHAPYSVSPKLLYGIKEALSREPFVRCSVHVGESAEELEFLENGSGPWRSLLEEVGAWEPAWAAPACDPIEYLDRIGFLDRRVLCVHAVHIHEAGLRRLASRGVSLVTCPRGNRLTGAGSPPIHSFYASGVRVVIGTDSLASVPDLNVFSELAEVRTIAPEVPARLLLESATLNGARALGWDSEFGSIEPGRRAALIAVTLPADMPDVEEYLVRGIQPEQVRWIE